MELSFWGDFNQPIKDANFPSSLIELTLGSCFDQSVEDANFPDSLLTFLNLIQSLCLKCQKMFILL